MNVTDRIRNALAVGKVRWAVVGLLFLGCTLNYIDRAALAVLQPVLAEAMRWTAQDYADINFWFQAGYAVAFAVQGRFIDSIGVKRAFALGVLLWSVAAAAHGLAASAAGFMICRFLLGLTEAVNYPACVKATRVWFPASERGFATGLFNSGTTVGAMIAPALVPLILSAWGRRAAFISTGALGILWLAAWMRYYHAPDEHPHLSHAERVHVQQAADTAPARVPYSRVLRLRATWAFTVAYAITTPVFWFYLYWLPPFLNQQYHLGISLTEIGMPLIVIYLTADFGGIAGGVLSSYMIARGIPAITSRLLSMLIAIAWMIPIVFATRAHNLWLAVLAIAGAVGAHQFWVANIWSLVMDIAPRPVVASVFGFGGMAGALGGMFMTQIVGYVLTTTHGNYEVLFTIIPFTYATALAWLWLVVPREIEAFTQPEIAKT